MLAARLGDYVFCYCGCPGTPKCPDGAVISASQDTFVENQPQARVGDICSNCCFSCCVCPNAILSGSTKTFVNSRPAAMLFSAVVCGTIVSSAKRTFIQ